MAAFQDAAREYIAAGIVPLPIAPDDKRPLVKHPDKFGRRAALEILGKFPDANVGFWCGRRNRVTVVDVDSSKELDLQFARDFFGDSPLIVRTASGKYHLYFRNDGERRRIRPIKGREIDLLGEGGLCVAPPSNFASRPYRFVRGDLNALANLPTIRRAALENLEPTGVEEPAPTEAVPTGQRNDRLFRLACELGFDADTRADLLERTRLVNAELCSPPLPDAEVQGIVTSVWRYKMQGRLMSRGMPNAVLLPCASISRLLAAGETDALALMTLFHRAHRGRSRKDFAASPLAMEKARLIGSWDKRRYRKAMRTLCELGEIALIRKGGRGAHDPSLYRFVQRDEGGEFAPQF